MTRLTLFPLIACITALLAATGCTHGTGDYRDIQRLEIGSSNATLCDQLFDSPVSRRTLSVNDRTYEWRTYDLLATNGSMRLLTVELLNTLVNGYSYVSTADEDRTTANLAAVPQIRSGNSTRQDVLQLLGPPSGRVKLPSGFNEFRDLSERPDLAEAWLWTELANPDSWRNRRERTIHVIFDQSGRVFQTATNDRPLPTPPPPQVYTYYVPQYYYVRTAPPPHHHH